MVVLATPSCAARPRWGGSFVPGSRSCRSTAEASAAASRRCSGPSPSRQPSSAPPSSKDSRMPMCGGLAPLIGSIVAVRSGRRNATGRQGRRRGLCGGGTGLGAMSAATAAQAASRAEVLITMVADPAVLRAVTEGPDGVAAGAGASLTVVEMSTAGPAAVARLAAVLPAATRLLDAPVMGSRAEAESGSLVIFAGGPAPLVERVSPLLSALGSVLHVGDLRAGAAAKLVANAALFGTLGMLGEAIALARGLGLPGEAACRVLAATPLAAQAERRRAVIEAGEYPPPFPPTPAGKDRPPLTSAAAAAPGGPACPSPAGGSAACAG